MRLVTVNDRWELYLPEHRALRPEWATGWERARWDDMHAHLKALGDARSLVGGHPPLVIDVGTEEGDLTGLFALWGCDVFMVEPNPRVWPNVRAIWNANALPLPVGWFVGFAGTEDRDPDSIEHWRAWEDARERIDGWPACAHGPVIGDHAFLHLAQHAHMVPTRRLDSLLESLRKLQRPIAANRKVDAITIDTEGSELTVLRGADQILRQDRPTVWVSIHSDQQWMDENYPMDRLDDVIAHMEGHGYRGTFLAQDHEAHWRFDWAGSE